MRAHVWLTNNLAASYPGVDLAGSHPAAHDLALPISAVYGKVLDCLPTNRPTFMAYYDSLLPNSIEECMELAAGYRQQGIAFYPWGVSRGVYPAEEGDIAGQVAKELGVPFILDLEDGPLFWQGDAEAVREWVRAYKHHASALWIAPDARIGHPGIQLDEWVKSEIATRWLPQAYWVDFQQGWKLGMERAYKPIEDALVRVLGVTVREADARIAPVLPGYATPDDMQAAIEWSQQDPPFVDFSIWMRGNTTGEVYDRIQALPDFVGPQPPASPPLVPHNSLAEFTSRQLLEELLRRTP